MTTTLEHVLWIGGPSASGKTTVATRLARRHGLRWYCSDKRTWAHRDTAIAAGNEAALRWETMTYEERTAAGPGELMELNLDLERSPLVVDDLRRLPPAPLVVADGTTLPRARRAGPRPARPGRLGAADARAEPRHPRGAWPPAPRGLPLARRRGDRTPGGRARRQCRPCRRDDRRRGSADGRGAPLRGRAGRGTARDDARRAHRPARNANEEVVEQARGYLARPWTDGDESTFVREFICECDDPECRAVVELAVADYAPGVSAHG